jgi:hypothetical protein
VPIGHPDSQPDVAGGLPPGNAGRDGAPRWGPAWFDSVHRSPGPERHGDDRRSRSRIHPTAISGWKRQLGDLPIPGRAMEGDELSCSYWRGVPVLCCLHIEALARSPTVPEHCIEGAVVAGSAPAASPLSGIADYALPGLTRGRWVWKDDDVKFLLAALLAATSWRGVRVLSPMPRTP